MVAQPAGGRSTRSARRGPGRRRFIAEPTDNRGRSKPERTNPPATGWQGGAVRPANAEAAEAPGTQRRGGETAFREAEGQAGGTEVSGGRPWFSLREKLDFSSEKLPFPS